jgi:hypothetical protein
MALELTTAVLRYLEVVTVNSAALTDNATPMPEYVCVGAVAEATAWVAESSLSQENLTIVNDSQATITSLLAAAEKAAGSKPYTTVSITSTTPNAKRALPLTITVLGMAWQQLALPVTDRKMTLEMIQAAEVETAYQAAGVLPPPSHAATIDAATIATEGTPLPKPTAIPPATTTRTLSASQVAALVSAHTGMGAALKEAGIAVLVPAADK